VSSDEHLTLEGAERPPVNGIPEQMECIMSSRQCFRCLPALAGLLALTACDHPGALPSGPSPRAEAVASPAATVDVAALQRVVAALAAEPGTPGATGQAIAGLPEAKSFAQRLDARFWAGFDGNVRSQPAPSVPRR
jgi:hypothetical protein